MMTKGYYYLYIMLVFIATTAPTPLKLSCDELDKTVRIERKLPTEGHVKKLFLATIHDNINNNADDGDATTKVVLSEPSDDSMRADFEHGMRMLIAFQGSGLVTELIAYCHENASVKVCCEISFLFVLSFFFWQRLLIIIMSIICFLKAMESHHGIHGDLKKTGEFLLDQE